MRQKAARFCTKKCYPFVSKLIIFQKVESDIGENLGQPRPDLYQSTNYMSSQSNRISTLINIKNILVENIRKKIFSKRMM